MVKKTLLSLYYILFLLLCLGGSGLAYSATTENFLSLADIHFDPYLSCSKKPCPLIQKLRQAPPEQWATILDKEDTSKARYGKDSNYSLLKSALDAAKAQAQNNKIEFVLILGDFLGHDYDRKYRKYSDDKSRASYTVFVKKTLDFYRNELRQAFPQTSIYWIVGNNDTYRHHYYLEPRGAFFKDMGEIAATLIQDQKGHEELLNQFPRGGYYALTLPQEPRLRLIVLNSVMFSIDAKGPNIDQAATQELDWFHQQLAQAAENKQRVIIAMHIPTGIGLYTSLFVPFSIVDFWKKPYSQRFLDEIKQYDGQIMGVFTGHIHVEAFHEYDVKGKMSIPFAGTPSISPIFGNSPGFLMYRFSEPDLRLAGYVSFRYSFSHHQWEQGQDAKA